MAPRAPWQAVKAEDGSAPQPGATLWPGSRQTGEAESHPDRVAERERFVEQKRKTSTLRDTTCRAICRIKHGLRQAGAQDNGRPFVPPDWEKVFKPMLGSYVKFLLSRPDQFRVVAGGGPGLYRVENVAGGKTVIAPSWDEMAAIKGKGRGKGKGKFKGQEKGKSKGRGKDQGQDEGGLSSDPWSGGKAKGKGKAKGRGKAWPQHEAAPEEEEYVEYEADAADEEAPEAADESAWPAEAAEAKEWKPAAEVAVNAAAEEDFDAERPADHGSFIRSLLGGLAGSKRPATAAGGDAKRPRI